MKPDPGKMSARSEVLGRVRGALEKSGNTGRSDPKELELALAARQPGVRPAISPATVALFRAKAEANLITIHDLHALEEVPAKVGAILDAAQLPHDISVAPALLGLSWPQAMAVRAQKARIDERLTVSMATAAIAETGSLVLCSGDSGPSSLSYAAEQHVIVLKQEDIAGFLEEGVAKVRVRNSLWPRAVNVISGPSRTADVAGIVVRPAHGPKAVHLLLIA